MVDKFKNEMNYKN